MLDSAVDTFFTGVSSLMRNTNSILTMTIVTIFGENQFLSLNHTLSKGTQIK